MCTPSDVALALARSDRLHLCCGRVRMCSLRKAGKRTASASQPLLPNETTSPLALSPKPGGGPDGGRAAAELMLCCPPTGAERAVAVPAAAGRGAEPAPGQRPRGAEVPQVRAAQAGRGGAENDPNLLTRQSDSWCWLMCVLWHLGPVWQRWMLSECVNVYLWLGAVGGDP